MRLTLNVVIPLIIGAIVLLVVYDYDYINKHLPYFIMTLVCSVGLIIGLTIRREYERNFMYVGVVFISVWFFSVFTLYNMNMLLGFSWLSRNSYILTILLIPVRLSAFMIVTSFLCMYKVVQGKIMDQYNTNVKA